MRYRCLLLGVALSTQTIGTTSPIHRCDIFKRLFFFWKTGHAIKHRLSWKFSSLCTHLFNVKSLYQIFNGDTMVKSNHFYEQVVQFSNIMNQMSLSFKSKHCHHYCWLIILVIVYTKAMTTRTASLQPTTLAGTRTTWRTWATPCTAPFLSSHCEKIVFDVTTSYSTYHTISQIKKNKPSWQTWPFRHYSCLLTVKNIILHSNTPYYLLYTSHNFTKYERQAYVEQRCAMNVGNDCKTKGVTWYFNVANDILNWGDTEWYLLGGTWVATSLGWTVVLAAVAAATLEEPRSTTVFETSLSPPCC